MNVGVDIVEISRFAGRDMQYIKSFLTPRETEIFLMFKTKKGKEEYLASRFAAKEAIFKATGDSSYLSYSVLNRGDGSPYIYGHPELKISISHDGGLAIAVVINT